MPETVDSAPVSTRPPLLPAQSSGRAPQLVGLLVLAVLALAAWACGDETHPLGGDAEHGHHLYLTTCASCHGEKGDGQGEFSGALSPPPRDLRDPEQQAKLNDEDLYKLLRDGGPSVGLSPAMTGVGGKLPDSAIRDIAAYVRTLPKTGS
jgi:cytochrome c553